MDRREHLGSQSPADCERTWLCRLDGPLIHYDHTQEPAAEVRAFGCSSTLPHSHSVQ